MSVEQMAFIRCDGRSRLGNPCTRAQSGPGTAGNLRAVLKRRGWVVNFLDGHLLGRGREGVLDFCPTHANQVETK